MMQLIVAFFSPVDKNNNSKTLHTLNVTTTRSACFSEKPRTYL